MFQREMAARLAGRLLDLGNPYIQIVAGPGQSGKTTAVSQAVDIAAMPAHMASADAFLAPSPGWIRSEWERARSLQRMSGCPLVIVLDGACACPGWEHVVRELWDDDLRAGRRVKVVLVAPPYPLVSPAIAGDEAPLSGRCEVIRSTYWNLAECRDAFGFSLDDFLFFGGVPGAASAAAAGDEDAWRSHVLDRAAAPAIARHALAGTDARKPALMNGLFALCARSSGREVSYNEMMGYLPDAGNTTTLARYLDLLGDAGLVRGLPKVRGAASGRTARRRSSPKVVACDTGFASAASGRARELVMGDAELRGLLVETAVGARLCALCGERGLGIGYWRDGRRAVDFVVDGGDGHVTAVEVASGRVKPVPGTGAFLHAFPGASRISVGGEVRGTRGASRGVDGATGQDGPGDHEQAGCTVEDFLAGKAGLPGVEADG